ncbi:Ribosomal protein L22e [Trinorchestia longiramus]|nr:Ribosomal protein L22e [Trinorchestia longiramus]
MTLSPPAWTQDMDSKYSSDWRGCLFYELSLSTETMPPPLKKKVVVPSSTPLHSYIVDCSVPAGDGIMNTADFKRYVEQNFKVNGKRHNLENVKVGMNDAHIMSIESTVPISKKYVKFLTQKYLSKHSMRDWVRVLSTGHNSNSYILKYYQIINDDGDGDSD